MSRLKYIYHPLCWLSLFIIVFSCSDTERLPILDPDDTKIMLETRADEQGFLIDDAGMRYVVPAGPPVIQFWATSDPEKIGNGVDAPLGTIQFPDGSEVSDYPEENKYPVTELQYPLDGSALTAVAYAPKELIVENNGLRLRVPDGTPVGPEEPAGRPDDPYLVGHVDIMTASAITGSGYLPFNEPLEFRHKQARVSFMAIKANTMTKLVRNVRIRVPYGDQIIDYLEWNPIEQDFMPVAFPKGYKPEGSPEGSPSNHYPGEHYFGQIWNGQGENIYDQLATAQSANPEPTDDFRYIGTVYLMPGKNQLECTISAHIGDRESDGDLYENEAYHYDFKQTIRFLDERGNPLTLQAGDSYVIRLIFSDDMISVKPHYPQWQPGGEEPLPIKPGNKD